MGIVKLSIIERLPTDPISRRLAEPLGGGVGKLVARTMQRGAGSVDDQFQRQGAMTGSGGFQSWPKTKPFGNDARTQARTLKRTGRYLAAWRGDGGAGGIQRVEQLRVSVGVDSRVFPQAHILQGSRPTAIRVTPKMRGFLAWKKGVYLKKSTQILIVEPRPFRTNPTMVRRARQTIATYVLTGRAVPA